MKTFLNPVAKHPVSVLMVYAGIVLFGITSLFKLDIELLPTINIPVANVITEYSSIPASEIEELVTIPLENALSSVKGVKNIYSVSKEGISSISLRFDWGTDIEIAAVEIREKIDSAYPYLPHGIKKPVVFTEDISDVPVITLAVFPSDNSNNLSGLSNLSDISELVITDLKTRLLQIDGVSNIRITGSDEKEIKVDVDAHKLYASNLTMQAVTQTIQSSIYEYPTGTLQDRDLEYLIKTTTGVDNINEIREIPILSENKSSGLQIEDIADIYMGIKERTSFFHLNGKEAIGILIYKTGDTGTLNAANNILEKLDEIKDIFNSDLSIYTIEDTSLEIKASIINLIISISLGVLAAFIILLMFFKKAFISFITIISIPVSISTVFLFMFATDISINIISLSGIAIGIGMIVDNSIVVLENLVKHNAVTPEEISHRTIEMGSGTSGSTITTLLVFLPILFIPGITGALFGQLALTISFLLAASFVISMTLTPALYKLLGEKKLIINNGLTKKTRFMPALEKSYKRYLFFALKGLVITVLLLIVIIYSGIQMFYFLPKEIMPEIDSGKLEIEIFYSKGNTINSTSPLTAKIENSLLNLPGIIEVYSEAGYDRNSLKDKSEKNRAVNITRLTVLIDNSMDINIIKSGIINELSSSYDFTYNINVPENIVNKLLGFKETVSLIITGADRENILNKSDAVTEQLLSLNYITDADIDTKEDTPGLRLELKRDAIAYSNISISVILETIQSACRGVVAANLKTNEDEIDIRVIYNDKYINSIESLTQIKIPGSQGYIELGTFSFIESEYTFGELYRQDRKSSVETTFISNQDKENEIIDYLSNIDDKDISIASLSAIQNNLKEIGLVFILAIVLMYLILGAQFESFSTPLLLLISLPLSAAGSFIILFLTDKSLNINSFFGILILFGTTINTSIILCTGYKNGNLLTIIRASIRRLKPILATVLTTVLALVPIAFNPFKEGAIQTHMAMAVIGGLITGTAATLLIFPVVYASAKRINMRPKKILPDIKY